MAEFIGALFAPLTDLIGGALELLHASGLPWWLSIIFLTAIVRSLLFPLTVKQVRNMRAMQELRPEMDKIKHKHQNNRHKQQEEQANLFRERGINPLGGCLPLLAQMPIFISMFYIIRRFGGTQGMIGPYNTQGSKPGFEEGGILWFSNLSIHDSLYILPVLSAAAMIAAMEITSSQAQPQQKWLMRLLPVGFTFIVSHFPAGLQLYVVTTNFMTLGQNYLIYHVAPRIRKDKPNIAEINASSSQEAQTDSGSFVRTEKNRQRRKKKKKKR